MFSQLSFPLTNDLYTFCAGFYAFYGFARVTHAVLTFMTSLPLPQIVSEMYLYSIMVFFSFFLFGSNNEFFNNVRRDSNVL
jgi:hypothetical protein